MHKALWQKTAQTVAPHISTRQKPHTHKKSGYNLIGKEEVYATNLIQSEIKPPFFSNKALGTERGCYLSKNFAQPQP